MGFHKKPCLDEVKNLAKAIDMVIILTPVSKGNRVADREY
jgi:hypothetical protein